MFGPQIRAINYGNLHGYGVDYTTTLINDKLAAEDRITRRYLIASRVGVKREKNNNKKL
jgi:hypothetical protein